MLLLPKLYEGQENGPAGKLKLPHDRKWMTVTKSAFQGLGNH
jgi:hypothetical protein